MESLGHRGRPGAVVDDDMQPVQRLVATRHCHRDPPDFPLDVAELPHGRKALPEGVLRKGAGFGAQQGEHAGGRRDVRGGRVLREGVAVEPRQGLGLALRGRDEEKTVSKAVDRKDVNNASLVASEDRARAFARLELDEVLGA